MATDLDRELLETVVKGKLPDILDVTVEGTPRNRRIFLDSEDEVVVTPEGIVIVSPLVPSVSVVPVAGST